MRGHPTVALHQSPYLPAPLVRAHQTGVGGRRLPVEKLWQCIWQAFSYCPDDGSGTNICLIMPDASTKTRLRKEPKEPSVNGLSSIHASTATAKPLELILKQFLNMINSERPAAL
jgi:hypothetical protein